jgi:hypothetical protein
MKILTLLFFTFVLAVFGFSCLACGGMVVSPVRASGFSDGNLSGGYSFTDSGETLGSQSIKFNEVGVLTFNGTGL